jgi:hypothetical protein
VTAPSSGVDAVGIVDTALGLAARREIFTADEAMELLSGVRNKVGSGQAEAIAQIVDSAEDSYRESALVDRSRVVDPLLDMRLALSP